MVTRLASGHSPKRQVDLSQIRRPRGSAPDGERLQSLDTDVRCPTVDGGVYQTLDLERVLVDDGLDLLLYCLAPEAPARQACICSPLWGPGKKRTGGREMLALLLLFPAARAGGAKEVAAPWPFARSAMREVPLAAAAISDLPLRA